MFIKYKNQAFSTLSAGITNVATSITLATGGGANFPSLGTNEYFYATIVSTSTGLLEIVKVTARSTDTLTVVRGQDGTSGGAANAGDAIQMRVTAADLLDGMTEVTNFNRVTVASAATTGDIWGVNGNQIDWTGTATCTAFPNAPQAGAERVLICAGACAFTAGANMLIDGVASGSTVTCAAGDQVIVRAVSTTQFKLSRIKYDGSAQTIIVPFLDKGDSGTTTQTLDYRAGQHQRVRATGNFTIATSNWPASGVLAQMLFELVGDGTARTITWPTINWVKVDGTTTTTFSSNGVTLVTTNNAPNFALLWTRDGGTTIYGKFVR